MFSSLSNTKDLPPEFIASALNSVAALWRERLTSGWTPPEGSAFPWEMVRISLGGLFGGQASPPGPLPEAGRGSLQNASRPKGEQFVADLPKQTPPSRFGEGAGGRGLHLPRVAIVCAGNTPLLVWPALCATLLSGATAHVKMSRHETLWPRLFMQSLLDVGAPELAARVHLYEWPGDDPRTVALVQTADVVIAYGSDASIAALRAQTPAPVPFFGFGHALSVGLWAWVAQRKASRDFDDWLPAIAAQARGFARDVQARGFARDVLMYGQGGCLSPHTIFLETPLPEDDVPAVCEVLAASMSDAAQELNAPSVTDAAVAHALRAARDMAHFDGHWVYGDAHNLHHGFVIGLRQEQEMPPPVGHGVVFVVPVADARNLPKRFGQARGKISSVGIAGPVGDDVKTILRADGISRVCQAGEMQAPPLDWPNGDIDLFTALPAALINKKADPF